MGKGVKSSLPGLLDGVHFVDGEVFVRLLEQTGAKATYLRRLLREMPLNLSPDVEGVRQDSADDLVRTLSALKAYFEVNPKAARALVLEAKEHARLAGLRNPAHPWRTEVLLHLNTWLENPQVYPIWADLKRIKAAQI